MSKIRRKPSKASKIKLEHFANVGVFEVFLEAVPTTFLLILINLFGLIGVDSSGNRASSLGVVLFGSSSYQDYDNDPVSFTLFVISCATSIFSAIFGMSRCPKIPKISLMSYIFN